MKSILGFALILISFVLGVVSALISYEEHVEHRIYLPQNEQEAMYIKNARGILERSDYRLVSSFCYKYVEDSLGVVIGFTSDCGDSKGSYFFGLVEFEKISLCLRQGGLIYFRKKDSSFSQITHNNNGSYEFPE
jgi:hypothetical protein